MIEIRAIKQPFRQQGISLFIDDVPIHGAIDQQYMVAEPIKMRVRTSDELYEETIAPLTIKSQAAQKLMDDLWDCGLRPSEGTGSAGQLAAVQKHLKDLRTILFNKLKITEE